MENIVEIRLAYFIFFAVTFFLVSLSVLYAVGCSMNDSYCKYEKGTTLSEVVDQQELYPWFAVISTIGVFLLLIVMLFYTDTVRTKKKLQLVDYRLSLSVFFFQFIGSFLFLTVILLPISIHEAAHIAVVQIAFAFILLVHLMCFLRIMFCEVGRYRVFVLFLQFMHICLITVLGVSFLVLKNNYFEVAFILVTISFYYYLMYEYWNVKIIVNAENNAFSVSSRNIKKYRENRKIGVKNHGAFKNKFKDHYEECVSSDDDSGDCSNNKTPTSSLLFGNKKIFYPKI